MSMNKAPLFRLSVMMFLQYAVWGAWLPLAARYLSASVEEGGLGFSGSDIGWIIGLAGSVGAITAPFIAGQLSDRTFRTERVLAVMLAVGGFVKWVTATQTEVSAWMWLSIAYSVLYMPTLALSNSLAFAHLDDGRKQFPIVRVWGTVGWIAASWIFPMIYLQSDLRFAWMPPFLTGPEVAGVTARLADSLRFSAMISWGYAVYCLTLPATHPSREAAEPLAFTKAFALIKRPSFAVLVVVSLAVAAIHQVYFLQSGPYLSAKGLADAKLGPAFTVGQFSEILVMAGLGVFLKGLGFRKVLFLGALAYGVRYWIWSMVDLDLDITIGSQVLHGVCYAFFFAAAYIYVDRLAEKDVRNSAQTVFGIIMLGGGPVLGGVLSGVLQERYADGAGTLDLDGFSSLWSVLAAIGFVAAVVLVAFFRDETQLQGEPEVEGDNPPLAEEAMA